MPSPGEGLDLRAKIHSLGDGWCLFRVETGAGAHTGPSGRYAHLGYEAEVQAWLDS